MRYFVEGHPHADRLEIVAIYTDTPELRDSALAVSLLRANLDGKEKVYGEWEHFTITDPAYFAELHEVPFWSLSDQVRNVLRSIIERHAAESLA